MVAMAERRQVGDSIHATKLPELPPSGCQRHVGTSHAVKRGLHPVGRRAGKPCVMVRVLLTSSGQTGIGTVEYNRWRIMPRLVVKKRRV
jgi:hypothetical protein